MLDNDITSVINRLKEVKLDNSILSSLKESNFIIKDEAIIANKSNPYLILNPPKELSFLTKNGTLIDLVFNVFVYYIETNLSSGKPTIKKKKIRALRHIEDDVEEKDKTEKNVINRVLYEIAQIEKNGKGKIKIQVDPAQYVELKYIDKGFSTYDIFFQKQDGGRVKKTIQAANNEQANFIANYLMKKNKKGDYNNIDFIYKSDFGKSFWENAFVKTVKRKPLSTDDLQDFSRKLYKFHKAYETKSPKDGLKFLINSTDGNIRATAIALMNISETQNVDSIDELYKLLNKEDQKLGNKPNFDEIYIAISELGGDNFSFADMYENLADLIGRKKFLESSLKSALKGPIFTLIFLLIMGAFTVNTFAGILFDLYDMAGEPRPALTAAIKGIIDFTVNSSFPVTILDTMTDSNIIKTIVKIFTTNAFYIAIGLYFLINGIIYFNKYTFYGRKSIHNFALTIPIFGNFFKQSEYEVFLTVASNLYGSASPHEKALPILKKTVKNYHIQGIINTAYRKFTIASYPPGQLFIQFPNFMPSRVANLFITKDPDATELAALQESYRADNDEFIHNLKATIQTLLLMIAGIVLFVIVLATLMPMFELSSKL